MDEIKAVNISGAVGILKKELEKRKDPAISVYDNRYKNHTHLWIATMKNNYYLIYKEHYFYKFGEIFNNNKGWGDSINLEFLDFCISKNIDKIIFCHLDGKLYSITPMQFKKLAEQHKWIRDVEMGDIRYIDGEAVIIREKTYSLPLAWMERFNPEDENQGR